MRRVRIFQFRKLELLADQPVEKLRVGAGVHALREGLELATDRIELIETRVVVRETGLGVLSALGIGIQFPALRTGATLSTRPLIP